MKISNKTFIVTGGASGLGEATVRHLVSLGANVVIFDLGDAKGKLLETEYLNKVKYVHVDVCDENQVQDGIDQLVKTFGNTLYGVINAAGIGDPCRVYNPKSGIVHSLKSFNKVMNVNVTGTFNVLRLAVQQMMKQNAPLCGKDQERGIIINTASIAAYEGQIGQASYSASKGAIVSMTLPLARELSMYNIRCVTIAPGLFLTPMLMSLGEKVRESLAKQVPYPKRLGEPNEYASLVQFLIENSLMNGEVVRMDGSIRMSSL
ncbi:short chain dehydrogenase [Naegleria gruberi]|uniref:Short chain dehydrogenase n=1 Tax=Naegleria gruberi TaxID=5762 RepID=D2VIW1_NAEGR|nr:short chain dehydrogenase [Naegleria gruberi]EFC43095.1 short chain dehydrogenase [Naegleria gruberi]|eukprot:XP_002675839.1 short chain dehydrogenase [Naegleria gruberi strain NEG-M]